MVILVNHTPVSDAPRSLNWLYAQYPSLREGVKQLTSAETKTVTAAGSLFVSVREYAVTHATDSKVSIIGTDNLINNTAVILRNPGTGTMLFAHIDRMTSDDLATMISKVGAASILQLHLIGGFADTKNVSESLLTPVLSQLHRHPQHMELVTCCVGEACTVIRGGAPWPLVYGVAVYVKNGIMFPAAFTDRGPDMDMRLARTLAGGETVGMLDIYSPDREELKIGPFSYSPMRSVDIWLGQSDDFILQSLTPCPEVVADRDAFVRQIRETLRMVKSHPYPSVTLFHSNLPRSYRKDEVSGMWMPANNNFWSPLPYTLQCTTKPEPHPTTYQEDLCLNFKQENTFLPWGGFSQESQVYY